MEEYFAKQQSPQEQGQPRPVILTIICVLTFIWSGMSMLSYMIFTVLGDEMKEIYNAIRKTSMALQGMDVLINLPRHFFLFNLILSAGSFCGALEMWKLKKLGFHFYTASQLGLLIVSIIFMGLSSGNTFLTIGFIALYAMNLKYMVN